MSESLLNRPVGETVARPDSLNKNTTQVPVVEKIAGGTSGAGRSWQQIAAMNLKTVGTIALLCGLAPLNLLLVLYASIWRIANRTASLGLADAFSRNAADIDLGGGSPGVHEPLTVLISGGKMTKAMQLARYFSRAGHRVVLCEMEKYWHTGHRSSNCVDQFYTVPKPDDANYADALLNIVRREHVDVYVPVCSPLASYYDSLAIETLQGECRVCTRYRI